MLDYSKLDRKFEEVINSISSEEVRKWDLFDELRLITEKFDELHFSASIESVSIQVDVIIEETSLNNPQFCGDNRFALAA